MASKQKRSQTRSGLFITFEGTEGAGKSTLIRNLKALIEERKTGPLAGREVLLTREPGGTKVAERIRSVILEESMDPWTEVFLYEAARAEHLATTLLPALERGAVVLCDRFTDSTLAYQAHARGLPWNTIKSLNRIATRGLTPAVTFHLDLDPALGLSRAREITRFEAEGVAFQAKVRAGFLKSRRESPNRWARLDAGKKDAETLAGEALKILERKLSRRLSNR
jgi:dTMP kinase